MAEETSTESVDPTTPSDASHPTVSASEVRHKPHALIFEYYRDVQVEAGGRVEAKCKFCQNAIHGTVNVTSNFVTHLKVSTKLSAWQNGFAYVAICKVCSRTVMVLYGRSTA